LAKYASQVGRPYFDLSVQPPPRVHAITRPRNTAAARPYYQDCFNVFHTLTRAALHTCTKQERNRLPQRCRFGFFFSSIFFPPEHDFHFIQPKILVLMQRTRNFVIFMAFSRYFIVFLDFFPLTVITAVQQRFTFRFFGKTPMGLPPFIWKNLDLDFLFWNRHIDRQKSADSSFHWQLF
jgi:hypothetical protein